MLAAAFNAQPQASIVVAYESNVDAYAEAVEGLRPGIAGAAPVWVDLHAPSGMADLARALSARETHLVIALGNNALAEVQGRKPAVPVIAAMALYGAGTESAAAHVDLDVSLAAHPRRHEGPPPSLHPRGHHPQSTACPVQRRSPEARGPAKRASLLVVDSSGPAQLIKSPAALKGQGRFSLVLSRSRSLQPPHRQAPDSRLARTPPAHRGLFARLCPAPVPWRASIRPSRNRPPGGLWTWPCACRGEEHPPAESPAKVKVAVESACGPRCSASNSAPRPFPWRCSVDGYPGVAALACAGRQSGQERLDYYRPERPFSWWSYSHVCSISSPIAPMR